MDTEGDEVSHGTVIVPLLVVVLLAILVRRQLRKPNVSASVPFCPKPTFFSTITSPPPGLPSFHSHTSEPLNFSSIHRDIFKMASRNGVWWQSWKLGRVLCAVIKEYPLKEETVCPSCTTLEPSNSSPQHDLLSFLISKPNTNPYEITNALLTLNLQAIPSCTLNLTNALYHLSACPKPTIQTLRKEIEQALRPDGWTTHALDRMVNLDSFIKETMRLNTLDALTTRRIAVVPHTFSDGTYIPQGTHLGLACTPTHLDASRYTSPTTFDAFRFGSGPRYELTTAAPEFLAWGLGRGACPGRFFAGAVMKLVLAHVVLLYDVREEDKQVPKTRWVGARGVPDLNRKVLLKKR
ncbi:hypothetical protein C0989_009196 [Termitomyces sp. Mn162]|nr:hypothetical protein C0989_009196 [Termitomyces sp. Mn162]